jgi:hypothetical protein
MQPEKSVRPGRRRCLKAHCSRQSFSTLPLFIAAVILTLGALVASLRPTMAAPHAQAANLVIGYPPTASTVSGVVTIQGTATAEGFENYSIYYAVGTQVHGETAWRYDDPIIDFVPTMIVNGSLGQWDTTQVPNGQYVLALAVRTTSETHVFFVNNLTVRNEAATPTPEPTETPEPEQTAPAEPGAELPPEGELPPPVGATIELPPTATPRPTPAFVQEGTTDGGSGTGGDDEGGLFSGDLFSVKAVREAFTIGVQLAFLLYAIGFLYFLTKAVIRYYLRQTRGKARS